MRAGYHPLKKRTDPMQPPAEVTICMVTYIPVLGGYFEKSLDVLRASLDSIWQNTSLPYDLMVFDNASCPEVREYLLEMHRQQKITYLVLSDENVGIPGAWNHLFQAAPGKLIAYSDSDIYFYPGWLEAHLNLYKTYPQAGMITGIPVRVSVAECQTNTLAWATQTPGVTIQEGRLMPWEIFWTHARSLGMDEIEARQRYETTSDVTLTYEGQTAFVGAGHFQFVAPKTVLQAVGPFPHVMRMGNERYLDERVNDLKYLRLTLPEMKVRHLGNVLPDDLLKTAGDHKPAVKKSPWYYRILDIKPVKGLLLAIYNQIFALYYRRGQNG